MSEGAYPPKEKAEVLELIREALAGLGRRDTPYSYGVAFDRLSGRDVIYFDLPRVSPLQFNIFLSQDSAREELIEEIRRAVAGRVED